MAVQNTPRTVIMGWTALAFCALGGYLLSKSYTDRRLKEYTTTGFASRSSPSSHEEQTDENDNKPLRRSVQRTL